MNSNATNPPMLCKEEIKLGMRVYKEQLANIFDTWIIIYKPKNVVMEEDGIIGFIGKETNEEAAALYYSNNIITPVYNDSIYLDADIFNWFSLYEKYEIYALVLADSPSVFQGLVAVENRADMQATIIQWAVAAPHNNPKLTPFKKFYGIGGHLFAIALLASLKAGFGGVVIGHPANKILFEHYINELGAEAFNTDYFSRQYHYTIILQGMNARKIYETYTFEEIEMEME